MIHNSFNIYPERNIKNEIYLKECKRNYCLYIYILKFFITFSLVFGLGNVNILRFYRYIALLIILSTL